jgi:hypothetical protein
VDKTNTTVIMFMEQSAPDGTSVDVLTSSLHAVGFTDKMINGGAACFAMLDSSKRWLTGYLLRRPERSVWWLADEAGNRAQYALEARLAATGRADKPP